MSIYLLRYVRFAFHVSVALTGTVTLLGFGWQQNETTSVRSVLPAVASAFLSYDEIRKRDAASALRLAEVPVEYAVSLPLPTKRFGRPGYAVFASPAVREPGKPVEQGAPDRWWIIDAHTGHTLLYALCDMLPIAQDTAWKPEILPSPAASLEELKTEQVAVAEALNAQAPAFFSDRPGDPSPRHLLLERLQRLLPKVLMPQYRAVAPDFFRWLQEQPRGTEARISNR